MNISPRSVDGSLSAYLIGGYKHFLNNSFIYVAPIILLVGLVGLSGLTNRIVQNIVIFFIGIYFAFLYAELTFVSLKEKYTLNKYLQSWAVAMGEMMNFIKDKSVFPYFSFYFLIGVLFDTVILINGENSTQVIKPFSMDAIVTSMYKLSGTKVLLDFIFFTFIFSILPTDYLVARKISGGNDIPESIFEAAIKINFKMMMSFAIVAVLFTVGGYFMYGLQAIIFPILMIALTMYSMDVFNVKVGLKQKQEQEAYNKNIETTPEVV